VPGKTEKKVRAASEGPVTLTGTKKKKGLVKERVRTLSLITLTAKEENTLPFLKKERHQDFRRKEPQRQVTLRKKDPPPSRKKRERRKRRGGLSPVQGR